MEMEIGFTIEYLTLFSIGGHLQIRLDPFDGAKPHPLGRGRKRHSGSTLSKLQPSGWGVEGLTMILKICTLLRF